MQHVYGHADEFLSEEEMSPEQRVNCRAKKLATAALIAAVDTNEFISSIFPAEKVCVEISENKSQGTPRMQSQTCWESSSHERYKTDGEWYESVISPSSTGRVWSGL